MQRQASNLNVWYGRALFSGCDSLQTSGSCGCHPIVGTPQGGATTIMCFDIAAHLKSKQSGRACNRSSCLLVVVLLLPLPQVTKVAPLSTSLRIVCCSGQALEADFTGVIRQQDVRAHEVDKVGGMAERLPGHRCGGWRQQLQQHWPQLNPVRRTTGIMHSHSSLFASCTMVGAGAHCTACNIQQRQGSRAVAELHMRMRQLARFCFTDSSPRPWTLKSHNIT